MKIRKNKMKKFVIILLGMTLIVACDDDILNQVPKDSLNEELVWTDPVGAKQFINGIYGEMQSGFDRNYDGWARGLYLYDGASDDGEVAMTWTHSQLLQTGIYNTTYIPWGNMWPIYYGLIRKTNVALENLDRLGENNQDIINELKGQVYFLRGMIYHELLRLFAYKPGNEGVPLIDRSLTVDDDLSIPRASYDDVVEFILADLDRAAELLPAKGEIEAGRATSGAAYALKGRVLMYAERWAESAAASKMVINNGRYSLYPDYRTLFLDKNNNEIIFAKKFAYPDKHHQSGGGGTQGAGWDVYNSPDIFRGATGDGGWGGNMPTQNFVGSYEMTDGLSQENSPLYNLQDPYKNLDPRFYATVVYNGATFRDVLIDLSNDSPVRRFLPTGYFLRKFHDEDLVLYATNSDQDWIFIRYAEVLLNYAEAQNEASGPDGSVYDAINTIRSRPSVNMPSLPAGLSQSEMREKIRNERRIELAFEEHRYFDIRRWGIANQVYNDMQAMDIVKNPDGTFTYQVRHNYEIRDFVEKMNVIPIPQDEIDKNPEANQILGW